MNLLLKLVPDSWCISLGEESEDDITSAKTDYEHLINLSRSYTSKFRDSKLIDSGSIEEEEEMEEEDDQDDP